MSFGITAGGNKQQTLAALKRSTGYGDTTHHDAVRDAAVKIVEASPDDKTFAIVANGHHDYSSTTEGAQKGSLSLTVNVF